MIINCQSEVFNQNGPETAAHLRPIDWVQPVVEWIGYNTHRVCTENKNRKDGVQLIKITEFLTGFVEHHTAQVPGHLLTGNNHRLMQRMSSHV